MAALNDVPGKVAVPLVLGYLRGEYQPNGLEIRLARDKPTTGEPSAAKQTDAHKRSA